MPERDDDAFCLEEIRRDDHDRYLTALLLPAQARPDVVALYAYNNELAKTRESVSEPILGQIRLQWWRESLDGIYGGEVREHPVVAALGRCAVRHDLPRAQLEGLIDARESDLEDAPPADLAGLEAYAAATSGRLSKLAMKALAPGNGAADEAATAVGTAWGLIGLVRSIAFHAQAQRLYIPETLLSEYEVDRRRLFDLKPTPGLQKAVSAIVTRAQEMLTQARSRRHEIDSGARRGLLLATLADRYARDIEAAAYDPFALPAAQPPRPLRLAWRAWHGRY